MQTWTIAKLLEWMTGYFTEHKVVPARLSAEMVLAHVLGLKRIDLYVQFDKPVEQAQLDTLRGLVKRAGAHEPVQYLIGKTEFYSLEMNVTKDCLIPRPETELLVEKAVEFLRKRGGVAHVIDLCTGSGCVAVAIAKNYKDCQIVATDISEAALAVAATNVQKHGVADRVTLLAGDLFEPVVKELDGQEFDLITANPPYVSQAEYDVLDAKVRDYEPVKALVAGDDGLEIIKRVIGQATYFLKPGGCLLMEIGFAQGDAVKQLFEATGGYDKVEIEKDFADKNRLVNAVREKP